MPEKNVISGRQFYIMLIFYILGGALLILPAGLIGLSKADTWIAILLSLAAGLLATVLYVHLASRFPHMTIVEYSEVLLGKWPGKVVMLLFLISHPYFIVSINLRAMGDFLTTHILPETPLHVIILITSAVAVMGVRLGLETMARMVELFFPWIILLFVFLIVAVSPQFDFKHLQPVLEEGIKPVLSSSITFLEFPFLDCVCFLMIFPFVNRALQARKAYFAGILIGGLLVSIFILSVLLVLGSEESARHLFPGYLLAQQVKIGKFLQRIEVIFALIWFITVYSKIYMLFYFATFGLAQVLNLRNYRVLTIPLGVLAFAYSILGMPNAAIYQNTSLKIMPGIVYIYGLGVPLLLYIVAVLRKKTGSPPA